MKKLLITIGLLTLSFSIPLSLAWSQKAKGPIMFLKEKSADYKQVDEGETIEHTFKVLNKGDQPLNIKKVKPGWGCTVAHFDKTILPGGEGKIILRVDTKGYQGKMRKTAKVLTNDPGHAMEILTINAFVKVPIYLFPKQVNFKGLAGQIITKTVTIKAELNKPLELETAHFNLSGKVTYRVEEVQAGRMFQIHFTSVPGSAKTYSGMLTLKTNYPEKPMISITIRGRFKG